MAYRGEDAGDVLRAETSDGILEVALAANRVTLTVGATSLHLVDRVATVVEDPGTKKKKPRRASFAITGIAFARGIPREDIGLWIEAAEDRPADPRGASRTKRAVWPPTRLRRILGVSPINLLDASGLPALAKLDAVALRLRGALEDYASAVDIWSARAVEIGSGHALDKVLFVDYGEMHAVYARKLFRDRAGLLMSVRGATLTVYGPARTQEVTVTSKFGITVRGDYIRFADRHGTDLARISVPWVGPEDREELARRIGVLVQRSINDGR
jgi:hypothetical protein